MAKHMSTRSGDLDMVVMKHDFVITKNNESKRLVSSLVVKGESQTMTAMAKTVGLPLACAARLLLEDRLSIKGVHIPVEKELYEPILKEVAKAGIVFKTEEKSL